MGALFSLPCEKDRRGLMGVEGDGCVIPGEVTVQRLWWKQRELIGPGLHLEDKDDRIW